MPNEAVLEDSIWRDDAALVEGVPPLSDGGAFPRGSVSVIHAPTGRSKTTLCAALALPSTSSPATAADRGELAGEEGSMTMAAMCTVRDIRPKHSDDRVEPVLAVAPACRIRRDGRIPVIRCVCTKFDWPKEADIGKLARV